MRKRRILIALALGSYLACSACCVWALAPFILPPKDRVALSPLEKEMKQAAILEKAGQVPWSGPLLWTTRYRVEKMKVVDEDTRLFCIKMYTFFYYHTNTIVAAVSVNPRSRSGFAVSTRVRMSGPRCEGEFR